MDQPIHARSHIDKRDMIMDGKPIKYALKADGSFLLYSVGEDGQDDGGSNEMLPKKTNSNNLWERKDFVWPAPASPEETEAWRKERLERK